MPLQRVHAQRMNRSRRVLSLLLSTISTVCPRLKAKNCARTRPSRSQKTAPRFFWRIPRGRESSSYPKRSGIKLARKYGTPTSRTRVEARVEARRSRVPNGDLTKKSKRASRGLRDCCGLISSRVGTTKPSISIRRAVRRTMQDERVGSEQLGTKREKLDGSS